MKVIRRGKRIQLRALVDLHSEEASNTKDNLHHAKQASYTRKGVILSTAAQVDLTGRQDKDVCHGGYTGC